jgi:type IV fimbrial biogenesis protein FimT
MLEHMQNAPRQPRQRGFTLVEVMVTLAIVAILVAMAAPGLARQRAEGAMRAAAERTMAALQLARRLALARGQSVTVCPSADGIACGFSGREWLMFGNRPGGSESRREAGEELLQQWGLPPGVGTTGTRGYAAFQPRPGAAATVTFEFRHPAAQASWFAVVVSQTGRPRLTRAAQD